MLNPAALVAIAGTVVGLLIAAFSLGVSRSPFWIERRHFALVAVSSAGYCAFDSAIVFDLPAGTIATLVRVALAFGVIHGLAWIGYLAAMDRRAFRPAERWVLGVGSIIALAGLAPDLLVTQDLVTFRVDWLGVTYRTPEPTVLGLVCYGGLAAALIGVVVSLRHRWHQGWPRRVPLVCVFVLALLTVNDILSSASVIQMPLLLDTGTVLVVLIVGVMHEVRFAANAHRLERASNELQRAVAARTEALLDAQLALATSQKLAGLGRLTASVAHEINNPITAVQYDLEQLRALADRDIEAQGKASSYIDHALGATQRIVRIVRRLVDAGRAVTADVAQVEPFLVAPVIREAVTSVGRTLSMRRVAIDCADTLTALGNAGLFRQVLENLLTNAAQALEGKLFNASIDVRAHRVSDRLRVVVADNGPGISESVRARLFEPFVTTKAVGTASGLGLAVSLGLMRSQKGSLALVQTSSAGTELSLDLPWTPLAPALSPIVESHTPRARAGRVSVLIIDDDADVRETLYDAAKDRYDVVVTGSVAEACAKLDAGWRPDVVLCDLMMPDGGAPTWLARCGAIDPTLAARTIIITAGFSTPEDEALLTSQPDRVLFKPFSIADMQALVARVIR